MNSPTPTIEATVLQVDLANRDVSYIEHVEALAREHGPELVGNVLVRSICTRFNDVAITLQGLLLQLASVIEITRNVDGGFVFETSSAMNTFLDNLVIDAEFLLRFSSFCEKLHQDCQGNQAHLDDCAPLSLKPSRLWNQGHLRKPVRLLLTKISDVFLAQSRGSVQFAYGKTLETLLSIDTMRSGNQLSLNAQQLLELSKSILVMITR